MAAIATISNAGTGTILGAMGQSDTAGALVMGTDYRGLGVVRSLGRRGIPVWVIKQGGHLVAATSRYVRRSVSWPAGDERRQIDFLLDLGARHKLNGWMLFPTDDYAVALMSRHHEVLASRYLLTVPPWKELRWACDKRQLHQLAQKLAIHQPWTACPGTREELAALVCPFPVVLKPAIRLKRNSLAVPKAWRADDRASLLARYDEACVLVAPENLLVQEMVPGGGEGQFSYAALCKDGCSVASVVARRVRQFPMDFGQFSTYVETVDEPHVIEPAVQLLKAIRFTGLAEVEFKRDPRNGEYKVLDINPRVWGWHTLARRAGVDFPFLLWLLVRNEPVPEVHGRVGERWMHMSADLPMAIQEILQGRLSVWAYLQSLQGGLESPIFAWDDPLPGLFDLPLFAYASGKRVLGKEGI
jgi:predicted ATP-grasp superfamily ATP-dependent carboligase